MKLNEYEVEFNEQDHQYTVNGDDVISVTQFIGQLYPDKYSFVRKDVLDNASQRGTTVHNNIQVYEEDGLESNNYQEFRDYIFLKKHYGWETLACEKMVVIQHKELVMCGRFDQLQLLDNKLVIADIKSTSTLDKNSLAIQLNLYKIGFEQTYGETIDGLKGIWLYKGKRKYVDIPINKSHTLTILEEYRRKLNENKQ